MPSATKEELAIYLANRQRCRVSQASTVIEIVLSGILTMLNKHGRLEIREFGSFTFDPGGRTRQRYNIAKRKVVESKNARADHLPIQPAPLRKTSRAETQNIFRGIGQLGLKGD